MEEEGGERGREGRGRGGMGQKGGGAEGREGEMGGRKAGERLMVSSGFGCDHRSGVIWLVQRSPGCHAVTAAEI